MSPIGSRCRRAARRGAAWVLTVLLMAGLLSPAALASGGAVTRDDTDRAIAIVFDNSGSMYNNMAWSQAIYAMEIFAAMLNDGDTLQVYPMYPIEAEGGTYDRDNSPLTIHGPAESPVIRDIYTPFASLTPIETITAAYNGLVKLRADEHWLIVLTDGAVFYRNDRELSDTTGELEELFTQYTADVNLMYLGIGTQLTVPQVANPAHTYFGTKASSAEVPAVLSGMCNRIFGRNALPDANISGGQVTFDIPMSKLIVFIQGDGISNISLSGAGAPVSTYSPSYSTRRAGNYTDAPWDTTLNGMIVTYENCPAGTYTLNYAGTPRSTVVYYEPAVDLRVRVTTAEGGEVTPGSQIYPGTYTVEYGLTDQDGNPVQSALLGDTSYTIHSRLGTGQPELTPVTSTEAGSFPLEVQAGDSLAFTAEVTFLDGYRIFKNGEQLGWNGSTTVVDRPVGQFDIHVSGGQDSYGLSHLEEQGVYQITFSYDGQPVTGGDLDQVTLDAALSGGNVQYDLERTADGYTLRLLYAGSAQETSPGAYTITLSGSYLNEFDQAADAAPQTVSFQVEDEAGTLELQLKVPQNYYVLTQLADGRPLEAYLTLDGVPLTEEQMAGAVLTAQASGLPLLVERIPGENGFTIRIDPDSKPEKGSYTISVSAGAKDLVGRDVSASAEAKVQLDPIPRWVYIVAGLLLLLLLLLLLWLFLNAKVLPKGMHANTERFTVDGGTVGGDVQYQYKGGGKHRGTLDIQCPPYRGNPMVNSNCNFHLDVEAVSPRRERSANRRMRVYGISVPRSVTDVSIGAAHFTWDATGSKLIRTGRRPDAPIDFEMGSTRFSISCIVPDGGSGTTVQLIGRLVFQ